jgi:hypothetical protein
MSKKVVHRGCIFHQVRSHVNLIYFLLFYNLHYIFFSAVETCQSQLVPDEEGSTPIEEGHGRMIIYIFILMRKVVHLLMKKVVHLLMKKVVHLLRR